MTVPMYLQLTLLDQSLKLLLNFMKLQMPLTFYIKAKNKGQLDIRCIPLGGYMQLKLTFTASLSSANPIRTPRVSTSNFLIETVSIGFYLFVCLFY